VLGGDYETKNDVEVNLEGNWIFLSFSELHLETGKIVLTSKVKSP
jgi:hypothetical protein